MKRVIAASLAILAATAPAFADGTVAGWGRAAIPPSPVVRAVTLDPRTTALLLLDFVSQTCSAATRPTCLATIPHVARLLARARAAHATIIYSYVLSGTMTDVNPALRPLPGEAAVQSGPDKFLHTDLAALLRKDGIKTVIITGTAAEGAVLATASEAAYRGYRVVLPYDGMSSRHEYAHQYVAWDLLNAPAVGPRTTLTRLDLISFR
jgi:nicotinamidase-related amidase